MATRNVSNDKQPFKLTYIITDKGCTWFSEKAKLAYKAQIAQYKAINSALDNLIYRLKLVALNLQKPIPPDYERWSEIDSQRKQKSSGFE